MGRSLLFVAIVAGAWYALESAGLSIDPRGVGTDLEGRRVVRDAGDIEAHFSLRGSVEGAYMLFGGDRTSQRNSLPHALIAGLPLRHARAIASQYPDFHMCKSPGAAQAQRLTESMNLVAADRATLNSLEAALELFEERLHGSGERTCIELSGVQLALDSVRVQQNGADLTGELGAAYEQSRFVLAKRVEIADCPTLLR
ncbi:MAG: hypothetical protein JRH16_21845 [Deltaproteobacteria bacterium]|nr:hypothetical protein [Deltaproteobacteria bacterium]